MRARLATLPLAVTLCGAVVGCGRAPGGSSGPTPPRIVVTSAMLGSLVRELVGDRLAVSVLIPNGLDPHEWEPSARDIEAVGSAALVVENGLGLEAGMQKCLQQARARGVRFFTASDGITPRRTADGHAGAVALDPHFWTDPLAMRAVVGGLASAIEAAAGIGLATRARELERRLGALDAEIRSALATIAPEARRLVTGHESMGYFAERYGFTLEGALVPSLSTQAEVSAAEMARLSEIIAASGTRAIFTEVGTPGAVAEALARDTGARVVPLATHLLPADGSYFTFMRELAATVVSALRP